MLRRGSPLRWVLAIGGLIVVLALVNILVSAGKLPKGARRAFDAEMVSHSIDPALVALRSVEKAKAATNDGTFSGEVVFTTQANAVSGCPKITGGEEIWCVVTDAPVMDQDGREYDHFLVNLTGGRWVVDWLSTEDGVAFEYVGCDNWDVQAK